jgi:hypothetical protein
MEQIPTFEIPPFMLQEKLRPLVVAIRGERVTLETDEGAVLKEFKRGTAEDRKRRANALRDTLNTNPSGAVK